VTTRLSILSITTLVGAAVLFSGCDPTAAAECDPGCEDGLVCNATTSICEAPRLEALDVAPSGRSVRLAVVEDRAYMAAVDPAAGNLLVGVADPDGHTGDPTSVPQMYVLSKITRPLGRTLAMASSATTVAVAWLEQDRRYRIALHQVGHSPDRWQILPAVEAATDYRGSEHFDLAIDASGRLRLVFHDSATGALNSLAASADEALWSMSVIDDPADQSDTPVCSEQQRRLSGRGLGQYPDVVVRGGAIFVAYHDADCGDLRLASRLDEQWSVAVVDTGDFERDDGLSLRRGVTGKFTSIALDSSGSLAIAYQDTSRGQLLIAYDREGQFFIETADAGFEVDEFSRKRKHLVGGFASLVFDNRDIPWIAYIDATTARLRLAHRTRGFDQEGSWAQQTVDGRPPTGFSASLGFSSTLGHLIATERLRPQRGGVESQLDLLYEEEF
jgi:hypothetical protein